MKEIGSEFWLQHKPIDSINSRKEKSLLSGRTALRFIIDDICKTRLVRKVLLPSYCCESMCNPFIQKGIDVQFYKVESKKIEYPYENEADMVLLLDYFGYVNNQNSEIARQEKEAGKIVIYDFTHKIDGNKDVEIYADYAFCSYRKWFYCNYAKVIKYQGTFDDIELGTNKNYIMLRDEAACAKKNFMEGLTSDKDSFLKKFSAAEQLLEEDYEGYAGEPVEFSMHKIISKRRENAECLLNGLKHISQIELWREQLGDNDAPMFVPILTEEHVRNNLRKYLIEEKIYCPIHWPKLEWREEHNSLYDTELSLVCDQRYDIADMERIVQVMRKFFNR